MKREQLQSVTARLVSVAVMVLLFHASAFAELFGPGDTAIVVRQAALKHGSETRGVLKPGTQFTIQKVKGNWVSGSLWLANRGQVSGWVKTTDVVKKRDTQRLAQMSNDSLEQRQAINWTLLRGVTQEINIRSTRPVDLFIFNEEGKQAYDWAVKHSSGQATSRWRVLNTRQATVRWDPPTGEQYYLVIDNTSFPDGGAYAGESADVTTLFWRDDPRPEEPLAGRGLIIGRVTLAFNGYEGRHDRITQPMTVHIAHNAENDNDEDCQVLKVQTDENGYFALANLALQRRYWVKAVEGPNFTAPVPFKVSQSISGSADKPTDQRMVLDVGSFALTVNKEGSMGVELESPSMVVKRGAGEDSSELHFASTARLDRHTWFLQSFPSSGWASQVRQDQARLEKEQRESASNSDKNA